MRLGSGFGELIDVGAGAGAGGLAGDRGDDLGVVHGCHGGDRGDDRDCRLAAAGHHVDVERVQVLVRGSPRERSMGRSLPASGRSGGCQASRRAAFRRCIGGRPRKWRRRRSRCRRTPAEAMRPSTPVEIAATPRRAARARPSDSGSMPTMALTARIPLPRMILIIRSVPMLPEPMIAAGTPCGMLRSFHFVVMLHAWLVFETSTPVLHIEHDR